ncbi:hypothetical protein [Leptospira idonii]|uniref:Uncharacterized protein n=1 Tax=Leptospira idonii TaxID=1193500 RepID=A0A4R9M1E4_9LEPT|nr:hypothetical protein [Leptospira idonii]TGN20523.1 hypothetical protein EHS15_02710 [Leptospira idonii]
MYIGYPGTESGPYAKDLQIFYGLDKLESLTGDFMMVESYYHLLKLKNLDRLNVDTFAHLLGYIDRIWTVFDALIFSHEYQRRHIVDVTGILKYKKELQLDKPFDFYSEDPKLKAPSKDEDLSDWNGWDEWEENSKKRLLKNSYIRISRNKKEIRINNFVIYMFFIAPGIEAKSPVGGKSRSNHITNSRRTKNELVKEI